MRPWRWSQRISPSARAWSPENRYTYYVRRSDDFIVKAIYDSKAPSFEMVTTQVIEKAPGLNLPVPQ